jgi:hypothetical protein
VRHKGPSHITGKQGQQAGFSPGLLGETRGANPRGRGARTSCCRDPRAYEMEMARAQIKTSIAILALVLAAGCSRLRDKIDDDDHHDEHSSGDEPAIVIGDDDDKSHDEDHDSDEGKTTTTTTVHEN